MKKLIVFLLVLLASHSAYSGNYRIEKQNDIDKIDAAIKGMKTKCNMKGDLNVDIDWDSVKPFIKSGKNLHMAKSCVTAVVSAMERVCTDSGQYKAFTPDVEAVSNIILKPGTDGKAELTYNCETKTFLTTFDSNGNCMHPNIVRFSQKFDDCE
jgi:hypothetical protein